MYGREGDSLSLAAAGDAIITRRLSTCEADGVRRMVDHVRKADASVVNLEVMLHDYEGYPGAASGGTYMRAPGWAADELSWAGFDVFAAANNHTGDYSHGGMEATMRELETRDIPYAGLGRNLAHAREPAYVDTPAGRVALVAACSSITSGTIAGAQRPDMGGRPGLAPLRTDVSYVVPSDEFDRLRDLSDAIGLEALKERRERLGFGVPGEDEDGFAFLNVGGGGYLTIEEGDDYAIEREVHEGDLEAFEAQIDAASRQADWVIATVHAHEGADGHSNDRSVPSFLERVARASIDAGADAFVGHGPHVLRGIELYEDAPIYYSLGNFLMQNETVTRLPAEIYDRYDLGPDALPADLYDERVTDDDGEPAGFLADRGFWESVLPIARYEGGELDQIDLLPLDLGADEPRPRRGRPALADETTGERILDELADLSDPYDTEITIEGGRGSIEP